ncbi:MAG: murein L,D-transpeptidase catalytic domain family protein [Myxococcaceae bacterium]
MRAVFFCLVLLFGGIARAEAVTCSPIDETLRRAVQSQRAGLSERVLQLAMNAYGRAVCQGAARRPVLGVIDYTLPSERPRLWVFDLENGRRLFHERVAHGKNSGARWARQFSNRADSLMTSLGVFITGGAYQGRHGASLRLDGLDPGINDRARSRAIVIHGARYVDDAFVQAHGRVGRSWGCPAVPDEKADAIIAALREGAVLFSWHSSLP